MLYCHNLLTLIQGLYISLNMRSIHGCGLYMPKSVDIHLFVISQWTLVHYKDCLKKEKILHCFKCLTWLILWIYSTPKLTRWCFVLSSSPLSVRLQLQGLHPVLVCASQSGWGTALSDAVGGLLGDDQTAPLPSGWCGHGQPGLQWHRQSSARPFLRPQGSQHQVRLQRLRHTPIIRSSD